MRKVIDIPNWYKKNRIIELRKEAGLNQTQVAERIGCVLKTYQNYEQGHNYPTIEYTAALAELYKVSIDYLLGRSDCRSVENDYISEKTGLTDSAIKALEIIKRSKYMNTLNFIMRSYDSLGAFLSNVDLYLDNKFDTPVHFDDTLGIFVESKDVSDNPVLISSNVRYVSIGRKLDYEVAGQTAFETLSVPVSILESHALHCIQQLLDDWKKEYKKGND